MADEPIALEIGHEIPDAESADFNVWFSKDQPMGTVLRCKAGWRMSTLGKRPHIAAKFTLGGQTYQMRLYPVREACGPASIVIDRELRKLAMQDGQKYGTWEAPPERGKEDE